MTPGSVPAGQPIPDTSVCLHDVAVHLHPRDNVAIAKVPLRAGLALPMDVEGNSTARIMVRQAIPSGHKIAVRGIAAGDPVRRYGQVIGVAGSTILAGDYVHDHNLTLGSMSREISSAPQPQPVQIDPEPETETERRTFLGFSRADGRSGTRNYIAVISTVNCSAHTCLEIAHHFTPERLAPFPHVDGVIALTYRANCSMRIGGPTFRVLQRTLAGMARHPNVAAALLVGLGCETNQACSLVENYGLGKNGPGLLRVLTIQELGGIQPAVRAGIAAVEELLPAANATQRTLQPASQLTLALQCGGSDGWSGVTANPVVGLVADEVVRLGGTVVLAETPEIYGAEHLLTFRAITPQVGNKLVERVRWWEEYTRKLGTEIDNNPTHGNKAGGLTTIYEKALGAVAKAGCTPLNGVYQYAEAVKARGLVFMDSPGFDPVSVTGQVASGCNLVLFTTGRGSVFGFRPAPSIKIASNTRLSERLPGDIDFDAGRVLGGMEPAEAASELLNLSVEIASGRASKSEAQGVGEAEFSPWHLGETL